MILDHLYPFDYKIIKLVWKVNSKDIQWTDSDEKLSTIRLYFVKNLIVLITYLDLSVIYLYLIFKLNLNDTKFTKISLVNQKLA